jgi:hypothetical protein
MLHLKVSLATRISVVVADIIVLAVTWYKSLGTVRQAYRLGVRVPLWEILLRDGQSFALNGQLQLRPNASHVHKK